MRQLRYPLAIAPLLGIVLSAIRVTSDYAQHNYNTSLTALRALDAFHYAAVQAAYTDTDLANDVVRGLVAEGPIVAALLVTWVIVWRQLKLFLMKKPNLRLSL